jgi:hypothetical protein
MPELLRKFIKKQLFFGPILLACLGVSFIGAALSISLLEETHSRTEALVYFYMSEIAALLLFIIPLLPVNGMNWGGRGAVLGQFASTQTSLIKILAKTLRNPFMIAVILCLIPGLSVWFLGGYRSVPVVDILRASFLALAVAILMLGIGIYASIVCRNRFSAAGFVLLIVVLVCAEPIWFGPILNSYPDAAFLIQASLLINPVVNVASALHFDILRTDPFYQICPIGQLKFYYPSYWSAALFNLSIALAIFWRSIAGIRRINAPAV